MEMTSTPIFSEIDLSAQGKHHGFLRLPHSVHRSAYGWIPIPITSVKNGDGPVVLLMAGNHGDEYEGQIALCDVIRDIEPENISGQIIILPMANFPAAKAGTRTSPIDDGNLNRSFPGNPSGTPTKVIAHYIESELLKRADYLLDIHSGGSSLQYRPSALLVTDPNPDQHQANLALVRSLDLPQALLFPKTDLPHYSSSAAARNDCVAITIEIAGAGTVDISGLRLLRNGLKNYLSHVGIVNDLEAQDHDDETQNENGGENGETTDLIDTDSQTTEFLSIIGEQSYCYAYEEGLFEPLVALGESVTKGQAAARIHNPETPWHPPTIVTFKTSGKVACKRIPAKVQRGDCLFEVAEPIV